MKIIYTILSCLIIGQAFSQTIQVTDTLGNSVNGTVVTVIGLPSDPVISEHLWVKQTSGAKSDIKLRRYELNVIAGTQNYFCWSLCYNPVLASIKPVWEDLTPVSMVSDSVYKNFSGYYKPNNKSGSAGFRYVWYHDANPNDSVYVDLVFDVIASVNNFNNVKFVTISPNPAQELITISNLGPELKIDVIGITGNLYYTANNVYGLHEIDLSALLPGIYFVRTTNKNGDTELLKFIRE